MKAYKGFDKDLKCRGMQYEVGKEYEITGEVVCCKSGFHACEAPMDVWKYYPPTTSRFCEVEQSGDISRGGKDSKIASSKIKIGAEIGIRGIIKAQIEYVRERAKNGKTGGYRSQLAGGIGGQLVGGDESQIVGGYGSRLVGGKSSILVYGDRGRVKGGLNSVIVLTQWELRSDEYVPSVQAITIDGEHYKPDTWYMLKDGEVVEVAE